MFLYLPVTVTHTWTHLWAGLWLCSARQSVSVQYSFKLTLNKDVQAIMTVGQYNHFQMTSRPDSSTTIAITLLWPHLFSNQSYLSVDLVRSFPSVCESHMTPSQAFLQPDVCIYCNEVVTCLLNTMATVSSFRQKRSLKVGLEFNSLTNTLINNWSLNLNEIWPSLLSQD